MADSEHHAYPMERRTLDADELMDRIYEAGAVPELWPGALERISDAVDGVGGQLIAVREGYASAISTRSLLHIHDRFIKEGWSERDPRMLRGRALNHPGFVNDGDLLTEEEIATDEVYENFYRKHGVGYMAGTIIANPSGDVCAFTLQRHQDRGPVPRSTISFLDMLRPHLARASMLSFRIGFERARSMTNALGLLGLPGAVLRTDGSLFNANDRFEALLPHVVQDRRSRMIFSAQSADSLFVDALARFRAGLALRSSISIAIPAYQDTAAMVAHLMPVQGIAHDVFSAGAMILVITPVDRVAVPTASVLQGLFDLTPAEARVAHGIAETRTVEDIAKTQGVSRETIRTQLKAVLAKTGLARQAELVSLLSGIVEPL